MLSFFGLPQSMLLKLWRKPSKHSNTRPTEWSMTAFLRGATALLLVSILASGAWASAPGDAAFNMPDNTQACSLPSITASSPLTQDFAVRMVSDEESAACDAANQNSCGGCDGGSCNCCGDECSPYACCCQPLWYVSAGAVFLHRDRPDPGIIVGNNPFTGVAFSRGSDFNFDWASGPDISIDRRIGDDNSLDVRFFDSDASASDLHFRTPGGFIGAGFTGPANTLFDGQAFTKLYSTEINWRHQLWDRLSWLVGFRTVELEDNVMYEINHTVAAGEYNYNNNLYGGQIGLDWALTGPSNPWQFNAIGKAGVYGNADNGGATFFQPVGTAVRTVNGVGSSTAFLGELDFTLAYALTRHIAIRGGYELLWLSDLALATDAASRSLLNPALLRTVESNGNLFYQGATVGLDFTW
jgi:hypothetical protein